MTRNYEIKNMIGVDIKLRYRYFLSDLFYEERYEKQPLGELDKGRNESFELGTYQRRMETKFIRSMHFIEPFSHYNPLILE